MDYNFYLVGTDGVGKSTLSQKMRDSGFNCFDRNKIIDKYMFFEISDEVRGNEYQKQLKSNDIIIFLVNNDKKEIWRRIRTRGKVIDKFDREANKYNILYNHCYRYMKKNHILESQINLADLTDLSVEESFNKVKNIIMTYHNDNLCENKNDIKL